MAPHSRSWWKRQSVVLNSLLVVYGRKWMHSPFLSIWPDIKYRLQGEMSEKGSLLAKPSGTTGTSLAWRTWIWAYMTARFLMWGGWHMYWTRNLAGSRESPKCQVCVHRVSGSQPAQLYQTSCHGFTSYTVPNTPHIYSPIFSLPFNTWGSKKTRWKHTDILQEIGKLKSINFQSYHFCILRIKISSEANVNGLK